MNAHAGIVLCGGASQRMGRPKAWLPWRGRTMVEHVVALLGAWVDEVVVVTSEVLPLPPLDARVVRDREPALGPLAGIREGLEQIEAPFAFVTGTDAPFLSAAFVTRLLSFGEAAAVEVDGHVQSLSAVYSRTGARRAAELLAAGRRRPLELLEALDYRRVAGDALAGCESVRGFNTPDAYLDAVRASGDVTPVTVELVGRVAAAGGSRTREVAIGTLAEVLAQAAPELVAANALAPGCRVTIDDLELGPDLGAPIGPGERLVVRDASELG